MVVEVESGEDAAECSETTGLAARVRTPGWTLLTFSEEEDPPWSRWLLSSLLVALAFPFSKTVS